MSEEPRGRGRPKKPPLEARKTSLRLRLTAAERDELHQAARSQGKEPSVWARDALLSLARRLRKRQGQTGNKR